MPGCTVRSNCGPCASKPKKSTSSKTAKKSKIPKKKPSTTAIKNQGKTDSCKSCGPCGTKAKKPASCKKVAPVKKNQPRCASNRCCESEYSSDYCSTDCDCTDCCSSSSYSDYSSSSSDSCRKCSRRSCCRR